MALIECPECSHKVSNFAIACPSCGCPIKEAHPRIKPASHSTAVVVSDFDMSFGKMVSFLVKASIAVIPAAIILVLLASALIAVFGVWGSMIGISNS